MMDIVIPAAEKAGYKVDNCVTSDHLPAGRPYPYMVYRNMIDLAVPSVDCVLKYGDTIADIKEGVNGYGKQRTGSHAGRGRSHAGR